MHTKTDSAWWQISSSSGCKGEESFEAAAASPIGQGVSSNCDRNVKFAHRFVNNCMWEDPVGRSAYQSKKGNLPRSPCPRAPETPRWGRRGKSDVTSLWTGEPSPPQPGVPVLFPSGMWPRHDAPLPPTLWVCLPADAETTALLISMEYGASEGEENSVAFPATLRTARERPSPCDHRYRDLAPPRIRSPILGNNGGLTSL